MKPRRNEEAQAHIGLLSHKKKLKTHVLSYAFIFRLDWKERYWKSVRKLLHLYVVHLRDVCRTA
jgi:hypothetical protein